MKLHLRPGKPEDAQACGAICYEAFTAINRTHNFPGDFPSVDVTIGFLNLMLNHPGFYSVVAEEGGKIVGSNFLDERNSIVGVGPITVSPTTQNLSVGRQLMEDVMRRGAKAPGVRLVQAAFHNRTLALYSKLGFDVREPLACLQGAALNLKLPCYAVRPAKDADLEGCNRVCRQVHGHDRGGELRDMIQQRHATVVEHGGRITGYASVVGFFGHAVGETNNELKALIGAAPAFVGPGFLLPSRNAELFRWCLAKGLRVIQPMTLMSQGLYTEPRGAFLPSIAY